MRFCLTNVVSIGIIIMWSIFLDWRNFMNVCHFTGNLTRDPELRETQQGVAVVNFGLAVNRRFKRSNGETKKEAAFLECEAWDSGARTINEYFKKGDAILVQCCARTESWEVDGHKRSRIKFRVEKFEFVNSGKNKPVNTDKDDAPKTDDKPF